MPSFHFAKIALTLFSITIVGLLSSCADISTDAFEEASAYAQPTQTSDDFNISTRSYYYSNYSSGDYSYGYHQNYNNPSNNPLTNYYGSSYGQYNYSPYSVQSAYSNHYPTYSYQGSDYVTNYADYIDYEEGYEGRVIGTTLHRPNPGGGFSANPTYSAAYYEATGEIYYHSGTPGVTVDVHDPGNPFSSFTPVDQHTGTAWCGYYGPYGCTYQ